MAAKTYTQYLEEILKSQQPLKNQKIKDLDNEFNIQSENIKGQYLSDIADVNNAYDDVKTIVPFETLRRKLADKYGEISKERAKDYKFGFLNVWPTDKDSVKLLSGYRPNYEKNSDDELAEIEVEIQKENFVLEEELDIDYVKYLLLC